MQKESPARPILAIAWLVLFVFSIVPGREVVAQASPPSFWEPADTFHPQRFWYSAGGSVLAYAGSTMGLYQIWYKDYELGRLRIFDDWGQWEHVDKAGHALTAYAESYLAFKGARWTGIEHNKAVWVGAGISTLLQTTVEVLDGFSERWGFSIPDVISNTAGTALFTSQQLIWQEQRVLLKISNSRPAYPTDPIPASGEGTGIGSAREAAHDLYGKNYLEAFIKDYNGMTIWASVNPNAFLGKNNEKSPLPDWLNIAFGYGAENVYGAYGNGWTADDGQKYSLNRYPRTRQFYLSLDIDTARIPTNNGFLKTLFSAIRFIKIPAPAVEWRSDGSTRFHPIYW